MAFPFAVVENKNQRAPVAEGNQSNETVIGDRNIARDLLRIHNSLSVRTAKNFGTVRPERRASSICDMEKGIGKRHKRSSSETYSEEIPIGKHTRLFLLTLMVLRS